MPLGCFAGFVIDDKILLAVFSLALSVISLIVLKKANVPNKGKIGLIYAHLAFLFFPPVLLTTSVGCATTCACDPGSIWQVTAIALPSTLAFAGLASFVVIPGMFLFMNRSREIKRGWARKFISSHAKKLGIASPKIYALDKGEPSAFSFRTWRSAIFLSVGMTEILNKKELQAVLLHELAHIANKSSLLKVSSYMLKFSPLSLLKNFHHELDDEERLADEFVARIQKSRVWLDSAKRKVSLC